MRLGCQYSFRVENKFNYKNKELVEILLGVLFIIKKNGNEIVFKENKKMKLGYYLSSLIKCSISNKESLYKFEMDNILRENGYEIEYKIHDSWFSFENKNAREEYPSTGLNVDSLEYEKFESLLRDNFDNFNNSDNKDCSFYSFYCIEEIINNEGFIKL